ncbi:hypothetical protein H0W32_02010 [Patescibacteria group bacterium]|nr:hypothetical protein [Patescibacteria group bacterium]
MAVEFDEQVSNISFTQKQTEIPSGMISKLLSRGIVKTKTQAVMILVSIIIIAFILSIIIITRTFSPKPTPLRPLPNTNLVEPL